MPGSFANPEYVTALGLIQRTAQEYFQPGALGMSHTESQLEFFLGHTAMVFCGSWLKSEMMGKIPDGFRLGAFNLPVVEGGAGEPGAIYTGAGYYFVFSVSLKSLMVSGNENLQSRSLVSMQTNLHIPLRLK